MYIIQNVHIYAPSDLGVYDILFDQRILMIDHHIHLSNCEVIDGSGLKLVPGFIDGHVHITGGGGENGFSSKTPEIMLSKLTQAGITTVLGVLGTDGISRNVENLLSKAKGLKEEGMNCYITSGSYQYPPVTITGDFKKDMMFIDEVVGCKLALSDHRASHLTFDEFKALASNVRVSILLSKKPGIMVLHMGDEESALSYVFETLKQTDLPITMFRPTHVTRNEKLLQESFELLKIGGSVDMTADELHSPTHAIIKAKELGIPTNKITISSDGQGSFTTYDDEGKAIKIGVSKVDTLYQEFLYMLEKGFSYEESLSYFTSHVAKGLYLNTGEIVVNKDADFLLLDANNVIRSVFIKGKPHIRNQKVFIKGTYE